MSPDIKLAPEPDHSLVFQYSCPQCHEDRTVDLGWLKTDMRAFFGINRVGTIYVYKDVHSGEQVEVYEQGRLKVDETGNPVVKENLIHCTLLSIDHDYTLRTTGIPRDFVVPKKKM